jgi:3',5'-cyclic AMP phosphodiesterase CpdA
MKRRHFVKKFGQGISSSFIAPGLFRSGEVQYSELEYQYPEPGDLENARNDEGHIVVRIEFEGSSENLTERIKGTLRAKKSEFIRCRAYFNVGQNIIDADKYKFDLSAVKGDKHIISIWLDRVSESSEIIIKLNGKTTSIGLSELISINQFEEDHETFVVRSNLMFHNEIGKIIPEKLDIAAVGDNFRFVIMADPQGGDPQYEGNGSKTRIKIHNAFIEESISTANALSPKSVFTLILGDFTDHQGEKENFDQMISFYEKLENPILLEIGNHETRYRSEFTPGYNMQAFENYFAAQKQINGLEKLVYSFDLGQWHFIVWPDPLRRNFWETHPHYFDWLERDLEKNKDRPVFFLQHVPMHPIGINPLVSYVNAIHVNRLMFDILSKHGNVRYVFSGHVHIPIKSSLRTAVTYQGINFINLPPAGYRPRAFGEEDLYGGPGQGICIVDVAGEKAEVSFKTVTHEVFKYPGAFSEYKSDEDPLWFNHKWEIEPGGSVVNGNFEKGLSGWMHKYVYIEEDNPSNICEVRKAPGREGNALYMFNRRRDYDKPGQDRLPQTLNQLSQVIGIGEQDFPCIELNYRVDEDHFDPDSWNGGFLWIEGYHENHLMLNQIYSIGKIHRSIGGSYHYSAFTGYSFFDIYDGTKAWNRVIINLKYDYDRLKKERNFEALQLNRLVLSFGVWTINKGFQQRAGVYYTDVRITNNGLSGNEPSLLNGKIIPILSKDKIWNRPTNNVAGEHQYVTQEEVYPY